MTTRSIVPNGDGEGSLGTASLKWGKMYSSDPASGENSGQVPTTAWVRQLVAEALKTAKNEIYKQAKLDAHPVGSYYWSNDSTSPDTLFGGTWEALPPGYTLIAQGSGSDSFGSFTYTAGQKYGERKHQLTTDELASHQHVIRSITTDGNLNFVVNESKIGNFSGATIPNKYLWSNKAGEQVTSGNTGGNASHNNIQPSIGAYGWKRTA